MAGSGSSVAPMSEEIPVLIIGGSLVGLTTAALLGHHGVASLSVERHAGTAIHPRAGHFQLRTMEILRQLGLEDARARRPCRRTTRAAASTRWSRSPAVSSRSTSPTSTRASRATAPTHRLFLDQDALEPLLRERALELGATLRNRVEAVGHEEDADGVTVTLRDLDAGTESTVRAQYVVAADGNRSPTRNRLGIGMEGYGLLSRSVTIYFRADCGPLLQDRNQGVIYVHNPTLRGFFRLNRSGGKGFLVVNTVGADVTTDEAVNVVDGMDDARARELLATAIGADMPMEVLDVAHWQAEANVATRFAEGRVFLAGDAAHVVPPNGGFGGNTGVQDAHNLAWKLAAVVKGDAGPALLDTYDAERRPLGRMTIEQAYTRYATRVVPERGTEDVEPPIDDLSIEIGTLVHSSAVMPEPGDGGAVIEHPSTSRGRPGSRAPHVPVGDGSTLDLLGAGFVLLVGPDGGDIVVEGVTTQRVDAPGFADAYGIGPAGASLVRPDGIVAWRSRTAPDAAEVAAVLDRVLSR